MTDGRAGRAGRAGRIRKGWRRAGFAQAAGVSQQTVSRIERDRLDGVRLGTLRRSSRALGIR